MKKSILILLGLLILSTSNCVDAKSKISNDVMNAIKIYRSGDYVESYSRLENIIQKEPANALALYYFAMSAAQVGKKDVAIENYEKVITLTTLESNIGRYANKGKVCLETPLACDQVSVESVKNDVFILNKGLNFSEDVKTQLENLKIDNLKREINRKDSVEPSRFKDYKDFSSMNTIDGTPSNDEIVAALRTLQRAGLNNFLPNGYSDLSMLNNVNNQNPIFGLMNNTSMNSQMIQAMLTNGLTQGF